MKFREIVRAVEATRRTLTLFNVEASRDALDAIADYFGPQHVDIHQEATKYGVPTNFAVLSDNDEFLAASPLEEVYRQVNPLAGLHTTTDLEALTLPDVMRHVDDTTFSDYGKDRMIIASREIEKRAYNDGTGTLHTGFQRLSLVESQRPVYRKLATTDLDVHVYGRPDGDPPDVGLTVHGHDAAEIGESWFVVYDGDGDDDRKCALLAVVTAEKNTYRGFWTYRADVVDRILDHLETTYRSCD